eukprot:GHRR01006651.1.p1 GENE.GHRR01006651.1~~GHRR01006651.1.p1  ORF type:complete len:427 (+),score=169.90 GHRR01006651.1:312-1592(+)
MPVLAKRIAGAAPFAHASQAPGFRPFSSSRCSGHSSRCSHVCQSNKRAAEGAQHSAGLLAAAHACVAVLSGQLLTAVPSWAVLNSPNAKIPRTVEAALRRSIPAFNRELEAIQRNLENIAFLLRIPQRKPWGNMASDVAVSLAAFDNQQQLLAGVPQQELPAAEQLLSDLYAKLKQLELAVKTQQPDFAGVRVADALKGVADLELLEAPGLAFSLPKEYSDRPYLAGRAIVELQLEKADGSLAFVDVVNGGLSKTGKVTITVDGYSAPVSAGNFIVNVLDGLYNNKEVQASYASVITSGDQRTPRQPIPLENLPAGTFDPLYRLPLDVQNGELPVLPLSIAGAVSMTHLPDTESFVSGDEWFVYKFSKQQAGLSGLAFDEGTFGVFGYVTGGMDVIEQLQTGDMIVSAKVVAGLEHLVMPAAAAAN